MDFLKEYLPNKKDRQDFYIALPVIALFFGAIIYTIFSGVEHGSNVAFFNVDEVRNTIQAPETGNMSAVAITESTGVANESPIVSMDTEDDALTEYLLSDKSAVEKVDAWLDAMDTDKSPDLSLLEKETDQEQETTDEQALTTESTTTDVDNSGQITQDVDSTSLEGSPIDSTSLILKGDRTTQEDTQAIETTLQTDSSEAVELKGDANADEIVETGEPSLADEAATTAKDGDNETTTEKIVDKDMVNKEVAKEQTKTIATKESKNTSGTTKKSSKTDITTKTKKKINTDYSNWKYKCLIIVGAFKRRDYADQLIKRLKNDGHPVHTFYRKGRLAVSIKHTCDSEAELQSTLNNARERYSKDAWVLRR